MTVRNSFFAALVVLAAAAAPVAASTITYGLRQGAGGPGTFELTASASAGDNFGLSYYAVTLQGATSIQHANVSPRLVDVDGEKTYGFAFARSADNVAVVSAAQDSTGGGVPVYGIGQVPGTLKSNVPAGNLTASGRPDPSGTYGAPVVLATGTYLASAPPVILGGDNTAGFLLTNNSGQFAFGAPTEGYILNQFPSTVIPEPATIALSGLALIGLLGLRRRSA